MGEWSGNNVTAFCYATFILRRAQSVALFKRFVNLCTFVSHGIYLQEQGGKGMENKELLSSSVLGSEDGKEKVNCGAL